MKKDLVSIIIPIYNGKEYLKTCLESIINQTYNCLEIICINDGSTDESEKIIQNFKKKNKNIILYKQKNSGQAIARNTGIKNAKGEYITFIDQDDYIESKFIETLMKNIKNNDVVISGYKRVDINKNILYEKKPSVCEWDKFKYCSTWGKLYRTDFIKNHGIQFGEYKIGEDISFILNVFSHTQKIKIIDYAGYCNLRNINSVSNNINLKKGQNVLMPIINDIKEKTDIENFDKDLLLYFFIKTIVHYIYNQRKNSSLKDYKKQFDEYWEWLLNFYDLNHKNLTFIWNSHEELKINILINLFIFFYNLRSIYILLFLIKVFTPKINK